LREVDKRDEASDVVAVVDVVEVAVATGAVELAD
jgi:hypothetical protein